MKPGDRVVFFPYTKPVSFGPGGYRATVERVHKSGEVSVWVTLPDGSDPVLLSEVPVGEFGTSEPGTVTPMAQAVVKRQRQPRLSLVKPRREVSKPEPLIEVPARQMGKAAKAEKVIAERVAELVQPAEPELVTTIPKAKKPKPAEPDLKPHWNGELHACPMCMRKHRGDGPYCSERCTDRSAKPPDLVFGVRRSLYFDPSSPKGKTGVPQGSHRSY